MTPKTPPGEVMANRLESALLFLLALCMGTVGIVAFLGIWFVCYPVHAVEAVLKKAVRHG